MSYTHLVITVAALLVGYLAGLLTFKRSNRWCPACGSSLVCAAKCHGRSDAPRPLGAGLGAGPAHRHSLDPRRRR
jgi:hypothetical protein